MGRRGAEHVRRLQQCQPSARMTCAPRTRLGVVRRHAGGHQPARTRHLQAVFQRLLRSAAGGSRSKGCRRLRGQHAHSSHTCATRLRMPTPRPHARAVCACGSSLLQDAAPLPGRRAPRAPPAHLVGLACRQHNAVCSGEAQRLAEPARHRVIGALALRSGVLGGSGEGGQRAPPAVCMAAGSGGDNPWCALLGSPQRAPWPCSCPGTWRGTGGLGRRTQPELRRKFAAQLHR